MEFVDGRVADADEDGEWGGKGGDDIDDVKLTLKLNYSNFSNWNDRFPPQPFAQRFGVRKSNFLSAYRSLRYNSMPQYQSEFILDLKAHSRYRIGRFEGYHMRNYPLQLFYWYWEKSFRPICMRGEAAFDVEFAYLHFEKRKLQRPSFDPLSAEGFLITPDGFFPYHKEDLTLEDFLKYDRSQASSSDRRIH